MVSLYLIAGMVIIIINIAELPSVISLIFHDAFTGEAVMGGVVGEVIRQGIRRAVFSNEAGIGSAAIAHSAVRTTEPITEGYVALLEPFIDTVVICTITALVITTTLYYDPNFVQGLGGIEMTSAAFERNISWSPYVIAISGILFAFSTMVAWSYYGL